MEKTIYSRVGETLFHTRLENGLPIYVNVKPGFRKAFAFFATSYGGMDLRFQLDGAWQDTPAGVAHFLEHKMFDTKEGNALQDTWRPTAPPPTPSPARPSPGTILSAPNSLRRI